jgi:tRNA modification GTPase
MWNRSEQTICAISTPHGVGGLAVIRISGANALSFSKKIVKTFQKKQPQSHQAYFSQIVDLQNNKIDEAVVTYFADKKSFTGEEVVEISCHGSTYITQAILDLLITSGCKMADKGEFTFRAFMNNKLDLVQAESVLALIESQSKSAAKMALRQLDGVVSKKITELASEITWCLAHIEASIDFIEQGIEVVDQNVLVNKLKHTQAEIQKIIDNYANGRLLKDGIRVALVGEPNVGKSSILNLLVQEDKAIVTPIAGTTRDVISGSTSFNGVKFDFYDTAGIRETKDAVEIIGIDKSKKEAEKADVLCFVIAANDQNLNKSILLFQNLQNPKKVILINKADLLNETQKQKILNNFSLNEYSQIKILFTSATSQNSRNQIFETVLSQLGSLDYLDEAVISSARQIEQAKYSSDMISTSLIELQKGIGSEFVAMYLKESLISLQKIIGDVYDDQILDRVFKEFCLGK